MEIEGVVVPFTTSICPAVPETDVTVPDDGSVCHVGRKEEPFEVKTCPEVPTPETFWNVPVAVVPAQIREYAVNVVFPVPP